LTSKKPISNLYTNVKDTITSLTKGGLIGLFQSNNKQDLADGKYPDIEETRDALNLFTQENWIKNCGYSFSVMSIDGSIDEKTTQLFSDFLLPINPSDINTTLSPSIDIMRTQGGTAVNHSGMRYGRITISGTTGVQPHMGSGGASNLTGKAILQPDTLKHRSGYEVFQRLQNWFSAYYQMKAKNPEFNLNNHLVFKNFKDGEFFVVEMITFEKKRTSSKPHFYDYVINLDVLGRKDLTEAQRGIEGFFSSPDSVVNGALQAINIAKGAFLRSQGLLREVEAAYESTVLEGLRKATLAAKAFTGIGIVASDISKRIITSTVSTSETLRIATRLKEQQSRGLVSGNVADSIVKLNLPKNLTNAITAQGPAFLVKLNTQNDVFMHMAATEFPPQTISAAYQEQRDSLNLPRSYFEETKAELNRVYDNFIDKIGLGNSTYNQVYGRTNTTTVPNSNEPTDEEIELIMGFEEALAGLDLILSTNALFKSPYSQRIANFKKAWSDGYPSAKSTVAVKEIVLDKDIDLERLAKRELNNPDRWVEIVELNDLKPPYIVQDRSSTLPNVKRPGDYLLIPQPVRNGFGTAPTNTDKYINEGLSATEKNLGVDLKLDADYDFVLNNSGEFQLVNGLDNAIQAIITKFFIEKGELLDHPEIGLSLGVGTKGISATEIRTSLFQTLSVDPRFEKVENLNIARVGSELRLECLITVKEVDQPVPVSVVL
jgi:hypothetical protein